MDKITFIEQVNKRHCSVHQDEQFMYAKPESQLTSSIKNTRILTLNQNQILVDPFNNIEDNLDIL